MTGRKVKTMDNKNIAKDFDDFIETVSDAIRKTLNTEIGQELTKDLLRMKLNENPNMTAQEWADTKSDFMTFLFLTFVKETPEAMRELGEHTYNELRKEV